jgi:hypothetical protein
MHPVKGILRIVTGFRNLLRGDMGKRASRALDTAILGWNDAANGDSWSSGDFRERPLLQSATGRDGS